MCVCVCVCVCVSREGFVIDWLIDYVRYVIHTTYSYKPKPFIVLNR